MKENGFDIMLQEIRNIPPHIHDALECLLVLKGSLKAELAGESFTMQPDDLLIVNRKDLHSFSAEGSNLVLTLRVDGSFLDNACGEAANFRYICNTALHMGHAEHDFEMKRLITRLLLLFVQKTDGALVEQSALLFRFLSGCSRYYRADTAFPVREGNTDSISIVLEYLNENYEGSVTLSDAAAKLYMSPQYFSKYFKARTGMGFLQYLAQLRLEKSVPQLLYTNDSIIKIAVANGFASAKAFTAAFQRKYGLSPGEYRRASAPALQRKQEDVVAAPLTEDREDNLLELLRYMKVHDIQHVSQTPRRPKTKVDLMSNSKGRFVRPEIFLIISELGELLQEEVVHTLTELRRTPGCDAVFVSDFMLKCIRQPQMPPAADSEGIFDDYNVYAAILSVEKINLPIYCHTDLSALIREEGGYASFLARFDVFLQLISTEFTSFYLRAFRFGFGCSHAADLPVYSAFLNETGILLRRFDIGWRQGIQIPDWAFGDPEPFQNVLTALPPQRISFAGFDALPGALMTVETEASRRIRAYHYERAVQAAAFLPSECSLYMPRWNTLAGSGMAEAGSFFRSALLADSLVRLNGLVHGVGVYLSSYHAQRMLNNSDYGVLALFLQPYIKRPIYFVLQAIGRMQGETLLKNDNILVTRVREGEYAMLFFIPQYVNPLYSIDTAFVEQQVVTIPVELTGLPAGHYRMKRFVYDKGKAGVFNWWAMTDMSDLKDPDVRGHLESAIQPDFSVGELEIKSTLSLHVEISFNGIVLIHLQKL